MKTLLIKKENFEITDLNDWLEYAGPVDKEKQWVDKRSAKEFAKYMLSGGGHLPEEIDCIVSKLSKCNEFILYPEYLTGFYKYGMGAKGPRHHDGLLLGDDIVIGIEAKADEPLDSHYLSEYDGTKMRYKNISMNIFGDEPSKHSDIRYQLVSGTMGTLIEADDRNISTAVLLIISFISKEKTQEANVERNKKDIETFKKALYSGRNNECYTPFSKDHGIKLFVEDIIIDLDKIN